MKSLICGASLAALILAAGLSAARVDAADEAASVEVVMKKLFAGKSSPNGTLKAAAKSDSPDWTKVKEASDVFARYAPALGENAPPKGDKDSWDKLTKGLAEHAKTLGAAVEKKDVEGLKAVVQGIGGSCKACHAAHRPE
ncbi:cytochrome c [Planctomyces sp. SH-PL62]|uniref:cytochrome c n=1 Tax=Planctomyces sp. SH-PL62 TaxID=1636152 RepID=UPI00078E6E29|nr:cytochrome c [Planctomyces sp. SH-PL62]AMV36459.1 Cytochrome C' [Planctomyces sp. SH-PL62]